MSTKQYILRMKKQIDTLRHTDRRCQTYVKELDEQTREIQDSFSQLGCLEEIFPDEQERTEMFAMINENLEKVNQENKKTRQEYQEYMANKNHELKHFHETRGGIFEKFIMDDIDVDALLHCLDTFTLYETNQIDEEQAKTMGFKKFHEEKHQQNNQ